MPKVPHVLPLSRRLDAQTVKRKNTTQRAKARSLKLPSFRSSNSRGYFIIYQDLHGFVRTKQATSHFGDHEMTSRQLPDSVRQKGCNILEALSNLLYLADLEADDPEKVRSYLSMSKERVEAMVKVLESRD
jgi:hypothetical protein